MEEFFEGKNQIVIINQKETKMNMDTKKPAEEIGRDLETFKYTIDAGINRILVEDELEKGLKEGEHYYILYWGYSDYCTGDRRWMGTIKAKNIDAVEKFLVEEMIEEDNREDIFDICGDENCVVISINVQEEIDEENESEDEVGRTEYLDATLTDEEPSISIFGDRTFWDITSTN